MFLLTEGLEAGQHALPVGYLAVVAVLLMP
jgi:hypothetical protein